MAETEGVVDGDEERRSVSELIEQLGRDVSALGVREAQLAVSRHAPEIRRAVQKAGLALAVGVAFTTAFVLLNWAIVNALSPSLSGWRAPAIVAAAWLLVGLIASYALLARGARRPGRPWWVMMRSDPAAALRDRQQAREQAEETVRDTLKELGEAVKREAGEQIASAVMPLAGGVAAVGEEILEVSEEMVDAIEEEMPGGTVATQLIDLVLLPPRLGLRMMTMAMRRRSGTVEE